MAVETRSELDPAPSRLRMIVVLGLLVALGPLTIDMYLPALPSIADELSVSSSVAQLTLTGTLAGLALGQLIVGPLFERHRIITQVAADGMNVVKLLPPLNIGQEEVDYFVEALDDVLARAHKNSGLIVHFGTTLAKAALHRDR